MAAFNGLLELLQIELGPVTLSQGSMGVGALRCVRLGSMDRIVKP
jgi:hypothetical protein